MSGFGNSFETEALPGALPMGATRRSAAPTGSMPSNCPARPSPRRAAANERSWLYRIRPSVKHSGALRKADAGLWRTAPCHEYELPIAQLRWDPAPIPKEDMTFLQGVQTMTTAGDANTQAGMAAHVYLITKSMVDQHFYNADGEMMFVLQQGNLRLVTEFGRIDAEPGEIVVIPRGVKFRVEITSARARLSLRKLRRRLHAAGARADRRQLPGQFARLPHACRGLRGQGHADRIVREMGRHAVQDHAAAFTDRRGGVARQLRALQIRSAHISRRSGPSASTIRIPRSSRC
jgi:homogentisate 1,2-dioxygenase